LLGLLAEAEAVVEVAAAAVAMAAAAAAAQNFAGREATERMEREHSAISEGVRLALEEESMVRAILEPSFPCPSLITPRITPSTAFPYSQVHRRRRGGVRSPAEGGWEVSSPVVDPPVATLCCFPPPCAPSSAPPPPDLLLLLLESTAAPEAIMAQVSRSTAPA